MKTKLIFIITIISVLAFLGCGKEETCACEYYEECIDGQCELKENYFRWGDAGGVIGSDLYFGVVEGNACIDTVVFNIEADNRFSLFVNPVPSIRNSGIFINLEISDTEFILGTGDALCYDKGWYANIVCNLFVPDSVQLKFLFWDQNTPPGEHIDSTSITLFK